MASLFTSMFNGLSGLRANSVDLSVIGDNIANSNTIGFKGSRVAFEDALGETLIGSGVNGGQVGLGVNVQAVQRILTQGSLANTGIATDLAIQGEGFFIVEGAEGQAFTRNGQFTVDQDGNLVTLSGDRVQGFQANGAGQVGSTLGDITVANVSAPPKATTSVTLQANLDSTATALPGGAAFDPANPTATSNFQSSITVFDSLGNPVQADVYYRKTADGAWEWHALTDGANVTGGTAGTDVEIATGTLTFDTEGKLVDSTQDTTVVFNPIGATQNQLINFNLGDPTATGGTGLAGVTQFAAPSAVSFVSQDGSAPGELANVRIESDGTILGVFSNGVSQALGQVAVATFNAADQLQRQGGNLFSATGESGQANIGVAGTGGRCVIVGGALEQSNVDVGDELVRMIIAQRSFQANSKIVSTADTLLGELINLKR
jgi:flagellar hook protein FlgE